MKKWNKKLNEIEMIAYCRYAFNSNNCTLIDEVDDYSFLDDGLKQSLYLDLKTKNYIFIMRQKGIIFNILFVPKNEIELFKEQWKSGKLLPYSKVEEPRVKR